MGPSKMWVSAFFASAFLLHHLVDAEAERKMRHWTINTTNSACSGSSNGFSSPRLQDRWDDLRIIYQNCTRVDGNIEITFLDSTQIANRTLDFLDDIEEVRGYVLIYMTELERISFKKLKIIWGDELTHGGVAMHVEKNPKLSVISMPNLRSIEKGMMFAYSSLRLCHIRKTVVMDEILNFNRSRYFNTNSSKYCEKRNTTCHPTCNGACWGPGEGDCQSLYRSICPQHCESRQCYNDTNSNEMRCCHSQCTAGCNGPTSTDCNACSSLKQCQDSGNTTPECKCVEQCTSLRKYNPLTGQVEANPDGYYTVDSRHCAKECPANSLIQDDVCVDRCGMGYYYDPTRGDKICRKCEDICPRICKFEKNLDSENIQELFNCTEIEGFIRIDENTFLDHYKYDNSYRSKHIPALKQQDLKILNSVRFVSDYVYVAGTPLESLSFLDNLEVIFGRRLFLGRHGLVISTNKNLEYLGLRKLKRVEYGYATVSNNAELCFTDAFTWKDIVTGLNFTANVITNRPADVCEAEGKHCHPSCDPALGCWGPRTADCRSTTPQSNATP